MAIEKSTATKVVVLKDPQTQQVTRVRVNGAEFPILGFSPLWQNGLGVSLTLVGVELSEETLPASQGA